MYHINNCATREQYEGRGEPKYVLWCTSDDQRYNFKYRYCIYFDGIDIILKYIKFVKHKGEKNKKRLSEFQ